MRKTAFVSMLILCVFLKPVVHACCVKIGRYPCTNRALIIGIDDYQHKNKLQTAVNDAEAVADLIQKRYGFREEDIQLLTDADATKEGILAALDHLKRNVRPEDCVFIYYAGHGMLETKSNVGGDGWWIPVDALSGSDSTMGYISNVEIRLNIRTMNAAHILLVSDSCYAGTLISASSAGADMSVTADCGKMQKKRSRWIITSGKAAPVVDSDGTSGSHSLFAARFLRILRENRMPCLFPSDICSALAEPGSPLSPLCGPLRDAGDQGGRFAFKLDAPPCTEGKIVQAPIDPTNATVAILINGVMTPFVPPITLESGEYIIEVSATEYESKRETVQVRACRDLEMKKIRLDPAKKGFVNPFGMAFVHLKHGTFPIGSPPEEPGHDMAEIRRYVTLDQGFYLQTTEVTQDQWRAVMTEPHDSFDEEKPFAGEHPVERVSWNEAQAFIARLNALEKTHKYRLPGEAEWEYACRAGADTPFWTGECLSTDQANYNGVFPYLSCARGENRRGPTRVKTFPQNPFGLYDMHGNLWEWCRDRYRPDPDDGRERRILRGGGWANGAQACRSANRCWEKPDRKSIGVGFRVARDL